MLYRSLGKIVSSEITNNNDLLIKAQGYVLLHQSCLHVKIISWMKL